VLLAPSNDRYAEAGVVQQSRGLSTILDAMAVAAQGLQVFSGAY
jgi:hypothetical protein